MATEVETTPILNGATLEAVNEVSHVNGDANGTIESSASSTVDEPSTSAPVVPAAPAPLPTYDDIFPALPGGLGGPQVMTTQGGPALLGGSLSNRLVAGRGPQTGAPQIRSTNVTKAYRVAPEERRASNRSRFGEQSELGKICANIMGLTGTDIQLTSSRDGTLNFLITGKEETTNKVSQQSFVVNVKPRLYTRTLDSFSQSYTNKLTLFLIFMSV